MPNTQPYYVMVVEKQKDTGVETRSHILTIAATNTKAALLLACNQFDTVKDTSGISRDFFYWIRTPRSNQAHVLGGEFSGRVCKGTTHDYYVAPTERDLCGLYGYTRIHRVLIHENPT
jgi:hypothetical protein